VVIAETVGQSLIGSCFGHRSAISSSHSAVVCADEHLVLNKKAFIGSLRVKELIMVKGLARIGGRATNRWIGAIALCAVTLLSLAIPADAQFQPKRERSSGLNEVADRMNANTVILVTGNPGFIFSEFGNDLAAVLNNGDEMRILPVISQGALQNIRDVRFLKGVDLGFTTTNFLGNYRRSGEIGELSDKIVYIARISNDHIHVLTRSNITALDQLRGQKVNFNSKGSGTALSAQDIFRALKIDVEEVNLGPADAFEKLKNGEIAATILSGAAPASAIANLKASDGYRLIPVPLAGTLIDDYIPARLTSADYPNLIPAGGSVDTIAASSVLIAYNWPKNTDRYKRIDRFVKAFFAKFAEFQKPPRNPKWRETNLFATIRGWKRFDGAEEALADLRAQMLTGQRQQADAGQRPQQIGQANVRTLSEAERNQLFQDFLKWSGSR
jgi:TRAP transporter TAXI family solute receptor